MAFSFFGKKDKKPAEPSAPEAKAPPTPPKVQSPPSSGTLPPVKPPQPTGLMPATISAGAVTTQPMGMVRPGAPGLKPARPGAGTRSTQRIVLPTPPGAKGSSTRSLPGGGGNVNGRINLPAGMILRCLPPEVLAADLAEFEANGSAGTEIGLPMNMILSQLPSGKVEVTLQELVPHFPPGFLQPTEAIGNYLQNVINLPLMDVVMRIPPDLLALRPDQKEVDAAVINMADPFTEEILREQAEAARRAAAAAQGTPNIIEESQAPQEEFVPSHQTVSMKTISPPRRPAVEPLSPSRTAATTLATPPSTRATPPPGPAATRPANTPTPMPLHQQLSISAPIRPLTPPPAPPLAPTLPIPAVIPPAPPPPLAVPTPATASVPLPAPIPVPSRGTGPLPAPIPFSTRATQPVAEIPEPEAASVPPSTTPTAPIPPVPRHTGPIPAPPPPRHTTTLPQVSRRTGAIPLPEDGVESESLLEPTTDSTADAIAAHEPDAGADDLQRLAALAMAELGDSSEQEAKAPEPEPEPEATLATTTAPISATAPRPAAEPIPEESLKDLSAFIVTPPAPKPTSAPLPPAAVRQPVPSSPQKTVNTRTGPIPIHTPEGEAVLAFNINTCTADDLVAHIEGVPRSLAEAVVKQRTKIGSFKKIEELLDVPGMTPAVYTNLTGEAPPNKAPVQSVNELLGFAPTQTVSLKDVTDRIACWPDVTGCLLSQANGLSLVGTAPAGLDKAAIVAFVPRMFEAVNKSFSEVTGQDTDALLLPTVGNSFHLFRSGDLYLIIMSRLPQMPERHMKVARLVLAALSVRE